MASFALIGLGELGTALARGLSGGGRHTIAAVVRTPRGLETTERLEARLAEAGTERAISLERAVRGAAAVLAAVPAAASSQVAEACRPHLAAGALYVDLATARPEAKETAARALARHGARYVDAAVLGTAAASGFAVPILASGAGAAAFRDLVAPDGLRVRAIDAPPGAATRVKLLRSVYMKGRDALVLEMLLAARHHGLDEAVVETIAGPGEEVPFPALAERIVTALAIHAERRADELTSSAELLRAAAVDPVVTEAGAERLRRLAALGLREAFHGERPARTGEVLAEVEARSASRDR